MTWSRRMCFVGQACLVVCALVWLFPLFARSWGCPVIPHFVQCFVRVQQVFSLCLPLHLWHPRLSCLGFCLVVTCVSCGVVALTVLTSFLLANMYSWAFVSASVTVVGCCKRSGLRSLRGHLVAISARQMVSAEEVEVSTFFISFTNSSGSSDAGYSIASLWSRTCRGGWSLLKCFLVVSMYPS